MTDLKRIWSPQEVEGYLAVRKKNGQKLVLPKEAYVTENFSWNEVLQTNSVYMDLPTRQVLDNLKATTEVLQIYRTKFGKSITITSGWRTPKKQNELRDKYAIETEQGKAPPKVSETSLHLEGLAIDFVVDGIHPHNVYKYFDKNLMGELEKSAIYTHVGLPTFSEKYLTKNGLSVEKFYKKLTVDGIELTPLEKTKVVKRLDAHTWNPIPSTFDPKENISTYKNVNLNKPVRKPIKIEYLPPEKHDTKEKIEIDTRTPSQRLNDDIREQYRRLKSRNDWMLERIFRGARTKKTSDASSGQGHWVTINGRHVFIG